MGFLFFVFMRVYVEGLVNKKVGKINKKEKRKKRREEGINKQHYFTEPYIFFYSLLDLNFLTNQVGFANLFY